MPDHADAGTAATGGDRSDPLATLRASSPAVPPAPTAFAGAWWSRLDAVAARVGIPAPATVLLAGALLAAVVVVAIVASTVWWVGREGPPGAEVPAPADRDAALPLATTTTAARPVVVHAAGAVARPGVYELPTGSRVVDLLEAAGGPAADADASRLNLAEPLADGGRLYVPRVGEAEPPTVVTGGGGAGAGAATRRPEGATGGDPSGPVDLNTATDADLDTLPGIGPATAAAIVDHRSANGPFRAVDDLLDVRGIGPAKLEQLRPLVTVGGG